MTEPTTQSAVSESPPAACSDCPRVRLEDVATSWHEFHRVLLLGALPMPCWVVMGDAAHKVTAQNHRDLARGMLMHLEVKSVFNE